MSGIRASAVLLAVIGSLMMADAWCASPPPQPPTWAFAVNSAVARPAPAAAASANTTAVRQVPGSSVRFTAAQVRNLFSVPDWFPDSHPPMPSVVASGRRPAVMACGYCHLPNGQGRPENAPLAGLPAPYIAEQIADLRAGKRLAAAPISGPLSFMIGIARNLDDAEISAAAGYFSQLHYQPWIRVVETRRVPRTRVIGSMYQPIPGAGTEPLGRRIIEVPVSVERTELRDSSSGFIAYVPVGSLHRGAELVRTGDEGRTIRCTICHGPDLRGLGGIPPIAGRSPSYLMRQLYDIRYGARHGLGDELMLQPTAHLSNDDMLSIVAYVASLPP
jgi:cytochrome c553